jgi:hypothetical protein
LLWRRDLLFAVLLLLVLLQTMWLLLQFRFTQAVIFIHITVFTVAFVLLLLLCRGGWGEFGAGRGPCCRCWTVVGF